MAEIIHDLPTAVSPKKIILAFLTIYKWNIIKYTNYIRLRLKILTY